MAGPFQIAGSVESWCGRCKLMLFHTIETLDAGTPGRVHCNTCNQQHNYKPYKPGEAPRQVKARATTSRTPQAGKVKASHYDDLLAHRDRSTARNYSPKEKFALNDLVIHPSFGFGITTALKDGSKVEILFPEGAKVLIHGR